MIMKTYLTYLNRNKLFTLVNVAGLSISLMFVLLISNMVTRQLTVDSNVPDADRISVFSNEHWAGAHYNLGNYLQSRYPEIEDWTTVSSVHEEMFFARINEHNINVKVFIAKKNFLDFFGYQVADGAQDAMKAATDVVLTKGGAKKLFGTEKAVGKTFQIPSFENQTYTVTAVIDDFNNSIFPHETDVIIPFENMKYYNESCAEETTYMNNAAGTELFLKTPQGVDLNGKAQEIKEYLKTFFWIYEQNVMQEVKFIPMRDFYFSEITNTQELNQYSMTQVIVYIVVGILILLMAVFNYISMAVAQTSYRAKEMATRRLLGSNKQDIFWRMIGESFFMTLIAFLLGFLLAKAVEPYAADLFQTSFDLIGDINIYTLIIYIACISALAYVAGFFPATILSQYNPMDVVKGTFRRKTKALWLRLLSIFQSGMTIGLLTCALTMMLLLHYAINKPLGYHQQDILVLDEGGYRTLRNELKQLPYVMEVSCSLGTPGDGGNNNTMSVQNLKTGEEEIFSFQVFMVDSAFLKVYDIDILEDRHLSLSDDPDFLVSDSTMLMLRNAGYEDKVLSPKSYNFNIAGQFRHFRPFTLMNPGGTSPMLMQILPIDKMTGNFEPWNVSVRFYPGGDKASQREEVERIYRKLASETPFDSDWYEDQMAQEYEPISQTKNLISVFTFAALVISILGLTAMSIYFIAQRKRDIAIRKVFGSSSQSEMLRLIRFNCLSLLASLVIAIPLIWIGVKKIQDILPIEGFSMPWWTPLAGFAIVALVSLLSVFVISKQATEENPVNNLKTE
jgi:putative ABC transport system permease protein